MSIATELVKLNTQRNNLAANLTTKGVTASSSETLAELVPKVLDISGGGVPADDFVVIQLTVTTMDIA